MKQVSHDANRLGVAGIMFEEHQSVWPMLHHLSSLFEGRSVFQIGRDQTSIALQHLADQKEIFLLIAYQEDSQRRDSRFCCCQHMVTIGIWEQKFKGSSRRGMPRSVTNPESG